MFTQYFGNLAVPTHAIVQDRGKSVLGRPPPGFLPKEPLDAPLPLAVPTQEGGSQEKSYRAGCPLFDGIAYRARWSKLEQLFEAEAVPENDRVRIVMLNLEG